MNKQSKKQGFTLVEVMVVAVIVAILAAVAIPLMSANKTRAIATEAEAALGSVRSALRAMYAETGAYNKNLNGDTIADGSDATAIPGIGPGDLNGRWFTEECYKITTISTNTYQLTATGNDSTSSNNTAVADLVITLNQDGTFGRQGF